MVSQRGRSRIRLIAGLVACGAVTGSGCVERRYTLRTEPPGALAIVNGEEIGPTPVSRSFTYYGDRDITFLLDGYQTQRVIQPIPAPLWDNLVTEFFTENLIPFTFRDERQFSYRLVPSSVPPKDELMNRGEELRAAAAVPLKPRRRGILGFFGFP
jgi:hypothetical protein